MIRKACVMYVNPECHAEYQQRHDALWAEMKDVLKSHGAHNYSIYLFDKLNMLFSYVEIEDEAAWDAVSQTEACKKWWAYMKDVMPSNPDNSPVSQDLKEVFYLK